MGNRFLFDLAREFRVSEVSSYRNLTVDNVGLESVKPVQSKTS